MKALRNPQSGQILALRDRRLYPIYEKVIEGQRLSFEDGLLLYETDDLAGVGFLANIVRERINGNKAYWVRNQHLNYTNICDKFCKFCSFYAKKGGPAPYVLSMEEVRQKLLAYIDIPITEIHIVGGIHPRLPYQYYLDLLRTVKEVRPNAHIKAFTMIELQQIQKVAKKPLEEVLIELREAGLGSMPGGGVEVLSDRLHEELFDRKLDGEEWLQTARTVHRMGFRSNVTMLYGHIERPDERVQHMIRIRELQDETGGFLTFIPLSFHPEGSALAHLPGPTGYDDLRNIAVARLMLDNIEHIKSFWVMNTPAVTQVALWYGADDVDGTIQEYEITRDPTTDRRQVLTREQLLELIREAGREPVERDTLYHVIQRDAEGAVAG
ncbi:MAG: aminodeoxyfutalosine synthase [Candidatus Poribacteria bacterium]|nr:MAG: aminodeoxyfutalosine synthase [Candidatus Poribacteria bacterium]